jgi:hypothetical protein
MDEDIQKQIKQLESLLGGWGETQESQIEHPLVNNQKKLLAKLKVLLDLQLSEDTHKVHDLREKLNRLKHGGGR